MAQFKIYTKIFILDNIRGTNCKWAINNYINSNKIDIITILTRNLRFEIFSNKDNSIFICYYQVFKINSLDKDNIKNIN